MNRPGSGAVMLAVALALGGAAEPLRRGILSIATALPTGWQTAAQVICVVDDVVLPAGASVKVRLQARGSGEPVVLGTFGIVPESASATGYRSRGPFRTVVTPGLHRALGGARNADSIDLELVPLGAINAVRDDLQWNVGAVRLETR